MTTVIHDLKEGWLKIKHNACTPPPAHTQGCLPGVVWAYLKLEAWFASSNSGATHHAALNHSQLTRLCPLLNGAPELLSAMVATPPASVWQISPESVEIYFPITLAGRTSGLKIEMPKVEPPFTSAVESCHDVVRQMEEMSRKLEQSERRLSRLEGQHSGEAPVEGTPGPIRSANLRDQSVAFHYTVAPLVPEKVMRATPPYIGRKDDPDSLRQSRDEAKLRLTIRTRPAHGTQKEDMPSRDEPLDVSTDPAGPKPVPTNPAAPRPVPKEGNVSGGGMLRAYHRSQKKRVSRAAANSSATGLFPDIPVLYRYL